MRLDSVNEQYFISGFYNQGEEDFIANYFIGYGKTILKVHPVELSKLIIEKIDSLQLHFLNLVNKNADINNEHSSHVELW